MTNLVWSDFALGRLAPLFFAAAACATLAGSAPANAQQFAVPPSARAAIIDQTNAYRQGKGLAPLSQSAGANQAAQSYRLPRANQQDRAQSRRTKSAPATSGWRRQILQIPGGELAFILDQAQEGVIRRGGEQSHALLEEVSRA